jgi:hypothetical protein
MSVQVPTQEDLDVIKLAFDDHLKEVDAKLLEYDGLPEREKHDFADLERRMKVIEDKLEISDQPEPLQPLPDVTQPDFTMPVHPAAHVGINLVPGDGEDAPYPEDPDNPVNPDGDPPIDPPPSSKPVKKHK